MLHTLPVEILLEIQLLAVSESLPLISRHIHATFNSTPPTYRARYILARIPASECNNRSLLFTRILRYPICSEDVLNAICHYLGNKPELAPRERCELPKRIFRTLRPMTGKQKWTDQDYPLPLLRHLHLNTRIPALDLNCHGGYALTKAVHARFLPLIAHLLEHGASPSCKDGLAVVVAIRSKDLSLVKMLVERQEDLPKKKKSKKRKLEDRLVLTPALLKIAVKCDAREIVEYLTLEKNVIPDIQTLQMLTETR